MKIFHSLRSEFHSILTLVEWTFTTQGVKSRPVHSIFTPKLRSDHWRHYPRSENRVNRVIFLEYTFPLDSRKWNSRARRKWIATDTNFIFVASTCKNVHRKSISPPFYSLFIFVALHLGVTIYTVNLFCLPEVKNGEKYGKNMGSIQFCCCCCSYLTICLQSVSKKNPQKIYLTYVCKVFQGRIHLQINSAMKENSLNLLNE